MQAPLRPLYEIAKLNHRLFLNCLVDLNDVPARKRPSDDVNNLAFIALHLLDARCFLIRQMGGRTQSPFKALLEDVKTVGDVVAFPTVAGIRQGWIAVERKLVARFEAVTRAHLARVSKVRFPIADGTVLGCVAFLLQHESYHIGQMALLRKYVGLEAMSYR